MSLPEDKLFPDCFNYLPGIFRKSFFFFLDDMPKRANLKQGYYKIII